MSSDPSAATATVPVRERDIPSLDDSAEMLADELRENSAPGDIEHTIAANRDLMQIIAQVVRESVGVCARCDGGGDYYDSETGASDDCRLCAGTGWAGDSRG